MHPDPNLTDSYFETPARAERLQLLQHLVRNASEVIYLRAPAGAGKSLFAHRLLDTLADDVAAIWLRAGVDRDVASVAVAQLGLNGGESLAWPDGIVAGLGGRSLLVVVDDADRLEPSALERLAAMHARGGRLLLVGQGGPDEIATHWDLQFVDLPPFTVEQSIVFMRARAGDGARHITDDLAGFMHHSAHGRPGLLIDALGGALARARSQEERPRRDRATLRRWAAWAGAVVGVMLVAVVLWFQDEINALFGQPPAEVSEQAPPAAPLAQRPDAAAGDPRVGATVAEPAVDDTRRPLAASPDIARPPQRPPRIALPELSRPPAAVDAPADRDDGPVVDPVAAAGDAPDVLDGVLQDALSAARREVLAERSEPVPDRAVSAPSTVVTAARGPSADTAVDGPSGTTAQALDDAAAEVVERPSAPPRQRPSDDAETTVPAPVEERSTRAAPSGREWLESRPPGHYTLQLVGARDRAAVEKFVAAHTLQPPFAIFERPLNGRPWYSLVAGDYASRDAAVAARARLKGGLSRADAWPRTFGSVQENLK